MKEKITEESNMAETKPKSYRIDEETAERIRQITEEIGEGQQAAFARPARITPKGSPGGFPKFLKAPPPQAKSRLSQV